MSMLNCPETKKKCVRYCDIDFICKEARDRREMNRREISTSSGKNYDCFTTFTSTCDLETNKENNDFVGGGGEYGGGGATDEY